MQPCQCRNAVMYKIRLKRYDYIDLEQSGILCALCIGRRFWEKKEQHASGLEMMSMCVNLTGVLCI